jgi:hypothetical protein
MMLELAAEMGVQIANPELQERLNVEIERRRPVPVPTAKPDWSRYRSVASGGALPCSNDWRARSALASI